MVQGTHVLRYPTDVPFFFPKRRREGPSRSRCVSQKRVSQKRVEENGQGTEKIRIYKDRFPSYHKRLRRIFNKTWAWGNTELMITMAGSFIHGCHKERCAQKFWMMILTVTRGRHRRPICYTFSPNTWQENGLPIVKMSFTNCVEWTREQAASRWRQLFALSKSSVNAGKFVLSLFLRTWDDNL